MHSKRPHGGSTPGREYIDRDRKSCHDQIIKHYFSGKKSKYNSKKFRRRFRMDIHLFNRILHEIGKHGNYFTQKVDAVGKIGLSPLQKMIAALRMLAYGCPADLLDEYLQIGESTAIESLKHFCDAIIGIFVHDFQAIRLMVSLRIVGGEGLFLKRLRPNCLLPKVCKNSLFIYGCFGSPFRTADKKIKELESQFLFAV